MTFFSANGEYSCDKIEHFGKLFDSVFGNNNANEKVMSNDTNQNDHSIKINPNDHAIKINPNDHAIKINPNDHANGKSFCISTSSDTKLSSSQTLIALNNM